MVDNRDYKDSENEKFIASFYQKDGYTRLLIALPALLHFRWLESPTLTENPSYSFQSVKDYKKFLRRVIKIVGQEENPSEKEVSQFRTALS